MNFEADLAVFAQACEEFAKQANADMVCISTSNGDAVAAVTYTPVKEYLPLLTCAF